MKLTEAQIKELQEKSIISKGCPLCSETMFWYEPWKKWICWSWTYMEGGCKTW